MMADLHPLRAFAKSQPLGAAALAFLVLFLLLAIFAERIAPYDPLEVDFAAMLSAPTREHWFGTDAFGRDIFSRLIYGARTALGIGILASGIGCSLGSIIGVASAYFGGRVDLIVQRLVDMMLAFPIVVLALVVAASLGRMPVLGIDLNLVVAIAIPIVPKVARVVRSAALGVRAMAYIDAARTAGFSDSRIVMRHMIPNVMGPVLVLATAYVAQAILLESALSFLGLGVTEPTPAWGLMLAGNATDFYREAPWVVIFPGLAVTLVVLAFNTLGDALRDYLDPKLET
jgi:peptide/nickel transport system permease protein